MIELNLLPPPEKKALALEQTKRWIVFYGSSVICILLIFIVLLGNIWLFLKIELDSVANSLQQTQQSLQGQDFNTQQKLADNLNKELKTIDDLQKNHKVYSSLLISLANLVPSGTVLTGLSINEKNEVALAGHAQTREQVLVLKDALGKSSFFENVVSPLENLIKQTDIDFTFNFNLRDGALIQP